MEQDEFNFDDEPEAPYQHHSETSREAAQLIEPELGTLRAEVLAEIRRCGADGATDDELQVTLGMNPSTERPRRIELWEAGHIARTERTRPTRSGRQATVWVEKRHVA